MSIFDILVDQISSVLGVSKEEVLSRFTKEQLDEILNNSLCDPVDDYATPFNNIDSLPCDDPTPEFLPEIELTLDEINKKIDEAKNAKDPSKCVDTVKDVNKKVGEQAKLYNKYRLLLAKLIEFQDSIVPIKYYFSLKSEEAARVLNLFEPILIEKKRLEDLEIATRSELSIVITKRFEAIREGDDELSDKLNEQATSISQKITEITQDRNNNLILLSNTSRTIPIFSSNAFAELVAYRKQNKPDASKLSLILGRIFSTSPIAPAFITLKSQLATYSETIQLGEIKTPSTLQQAIAGNYIDFKVKFPNLDSIPLDEEKYDESTGARNIEKGQFKIKENQLLTTNSFFNSIQRFEISQRLEQNLPSGALYEKYYNLFEDPINKFFTLEERGLTVNSAEVDAKLKGGNFETKREGESEYFIKDLELVQNFYKNFEERLDLRTDEVKKRDIAPLQDEIKFTIESFVKNEIQTLLAIGGVNVTTRAESTFLNSVLDSLDQENSKFASIYAELDSEISRIKLLLPTLKPNQESVKKMLADDNPDCFKNINTTPESCPDVFEKLGIDPLGLDTLGGIDGSLPTSIKYCYWVEFSKILNLLGLMPVPNLPNVTQLRYWPVGLTIPAPNGVVKIPLPIIYIPLVVISIPAGTFVLFLTVNGIFISPMLFFNSNSGYKQFIITALGPSQKFGYDSQDDPIKLSILTTVAIEAALEKAKRVATQLILGKNYHLDPQDRVDIEQSKAILRRKIADPALENTIQKKRAERELKNLEEAEQNLGGFETFQKMVDAFESPDDIVSDLRKYIISQINKLGNPRLNKSNKVKDKIKEKRKKQRDKLKKSLVDGDEEEAKSLREKIKTEYVDIRVKIEALKSDILDYYDKIKFPVIRIPKNSRQIDPKLNAIFDLINAVLDFVQTSGSQFFSSYDIKIKNTLFKYLAKAKEDIDAEIDKLLGPNGKIDLEKEIEKFQEALNKTTDSILSRLFGKKADVEIEKSAKQILDLQKKLELETDPVKRKLIQLQIQRLGLEQSKFGDFMLNFSKGTLNVVNELQFSQLTVDFNPYSPCCKKADFSLNEEISEIRPILELLKQFLSTFIQSIDSIKAINLAGGRKIVSVSDIKAIYGGILQQIPQQFNLPLPIFDIQKFLNYFSNLLIPFIEPKAPIEAAQPALPAGLVIDLNLLKQPLLNLLLSYLNDLFSKIQQQAQTPTGNNPLTSSLNASFAPGAIDFQQQSEEEVVTTRQARTQSPETQIASQIIIDGCYDTSQENNNSFFSTRAEPISTGSPTDSLIEGPPTRPTQSGQSIPISTTPRRSNIRQYRTSNARSTSGDNIYPLLLTIINRFSDLNSEDITAMLKNFFDLEFDRVAKLLNGFYTVIKVIKHTKKENINAIEYAQNKALPYGAPNDAKFFLLNTLKKALPDSILTQFVDQAKLEVAKQLVEQFLKPVSDSPLPILLVAGAGALDSALPPIKLPQVNPILGTINTTDLKISKMALRALHPVLNQDDIPPWERLSYKNILFLLFLDEFASTAADQTGFFRSFL